LNFLWSLLGSLAAAFLTGAGFFLISAWILVKNASKELTLAALRQASTLENYLAKSSGESSFKDFM